MERVQKIIRHPAFKKSMRMIEALEKERIFCGHDMKHLLDVSRIAWIETLEQSLDYPKDVIYGAGLLHDVGNIFSTRKVPAIMWPVRISAGKFLTMPAIRRKRQKKSAGRF